MKGGENCRKPVKIMSISISNETSKEPRAYIFDLDGTLCDTLPDLVSAMNSMLRRLNYPERSREELLSFINRGNRYFVWRSLPDGVAATPDDPAVDRAMAVNAEEYEKCYADKTREYAGMTETLKRLKSSGAKLGILTNKRDPFAKKIAAKLFPDIFDTVRGNIDGTPAKPDPAPALEVAAALGVSAKECAFIGDSDIDMKTAVNSGMLPVGVLWGYRSMSCLASAGARLIVSTPADLTTLAHPTI